MHLLQRRISIRAAREGSMRRFFFASVSLFVAAIVVVLASPVLRAQQDHDHASVAAAGQACACCGESGSKAMNHEAAQTPAKPDMPDMKAMDHSAGGGCCAGMAMGRGEGGAAPMAMGDPSMMSDMQLFHFLLDNRASIRRTVTVLPNGIDTLTESDKPEVAAKLKIHVSAMYARLKDGRAIHQRDPLFRELFAHADQIDAVITNTADGLHVVETSTDPAVAHLLHRHAEIVDAFIATGMAEMMKDHAVK
jgi:hypothetical protein